MRGRRSRPRRSSGRAAAGDAPRVAAGRSEVAASASARSRTLSSQAEGGTISSTSRQSSARRPRAPFLGGAEHIGQVAPHLALVGQPGQAAGAGQDAEQRHLGQRHRRAAVVDQHDVVAGQRQLVAAAGRGAAKRRQVALPGIGRGVLDREPRLVGELAEIDLVRVRRPGQRADIGAGAEHVRPCPSGSRRRAPPGARSAAGSPHRPIRYRRRDRRN